MLKLLSATIILIFWFCLLHPARAQPPLMAVLDNKPGEPQVIIRDGREEARVAISLFTEEERIELARAMEAAIPQMPKQQRQHVRKLFDKRFGPYLPKFSTQSVPPAKFQSAGITLQTDLPAVEAKELLARLDAVLERATRYWGHKLSERLDCYVVRDLARWSATPFPPEAVAKLKRREGVTIVQQQQRIKTEGKQRKVELITQAVCYASDRGGVAQHELVHSYCAKAFGSTGPFWYAEGMAEVANYMQPGDAAVRAPYIVLHHLRTSRPVPLARLTAPTTKDDSWQAYARCWALCHVLNYNANYNTRFRALGKSMLGGQPTSFHDLFSAQAERIEFEYRFFLKHVVPGFRADLCRWDWSECSPLDPGSTASATVEARRGWQATGAAVKAGQRYTYQASGQWQIEPSGLKLTPAGGKDGRGRLVAVVLTGMKLGQPLELGPQGNFTAAADGHLYLRCKDDWSALADNEGSVSVKIGR